MIVILGFDSFDGHRVQSVDTPTINDMTESGVMRTFESLEPSELMTTVLWPSLLAGDHPKHLYPEYYESDSPFNVWMQGEWDVDALNTPPVQRLEGFTVRRLSSLFDRKRQEQIRGRVREVSERNPTSRWVLTRRLVSWTSQVHLSSSRFLESTSTFRIWY